MTEKMWTIKSLYYGKITVPKSLMTPGVDPDIIVNSPYLGFLLQNGEENILVDTGIHQDNIVDGRAWGGFEAEGGHSYVLDALDKQNLKAGDIDSVIYTHLHNDHAGGLTLFPDSKTYFQKAEYENLMNQLPSQKVRGDYDKRTAEEVNLLSDIYLVDGDLILENGLELYKTPGHTLGCMAIGVPTTEGKYFIVGDMPHCVMCLFPEENKMQLLDGSYIDVTPAPENIRPYMFSSMIYDHWAAYDSYNKLKNLSKNFEPKYYLTSHDPCVIIKGQWG